MANVQRGERELKLCGEVYKLVPDFESMDLMEQKAGCSLTALANKFIARNVSLREMTAVIYGGMKGAAEKKTEGLTFKEVGDMIAKHGVIHLIAPVGEFMAAALSGDGDQSKGEEKPA